MLRKIIRREISKSKGKYLAILAIVALGVGFFSGLDATRPAMMETGNAYLENHRFYDFSLISTAGYDKKSVKTIREEKNVQAAEGSRSCDITGTNSKEGQVFKVHSMPQEINTLKVQKGRLPKKPGECIIDSELPNSSSMVGKKISFNEEGKAPGDSDFRHEKWQVVGTCSSPLYMNLERGTSSLGSGSVDGFIYIPMKEFRQDYFTEVFVRTKGTHRIHTEAYKNRIHKEKKKMKELAAKTAQARMDRLQQNAMLLYSVSGPVAMMTPQIPDKPEVFVLTRNENTGYMCFDNDTSITGSIGKIFPLFFILVVALVSITTMTRIIEEQRSEQGTLKALGYTDGNLLTMYNMYSCSASWIGTITGYFAGTLIIPKLIWHSYTSVYGFTDHPKTVFNIKAGVVSIAVATLLSILTTWLAARSNLSEVPAELIRPKEGKKGKAILLERIKPLWKKIPLLYRISLRNTFRYKKRFFMMILGISGCTALLITGFGISDSMDNLVPSQYGKIFHYDYQVQLKKPVDLQGEKDFSRNFNREDKLLFIDRKTVKVKNKDISKNINLIISAKDDFDHFITLKDGDKKTPYPREGETVITKRYAEDLNLEKGDMVTFITDDYQKIRAKVSGVTENYIDNYAYIKCATWTSQTGHAPLCATLLVKSAEQGKYTEDQVKSLRKKNTVMNVSMSSDFRDRVDTMMKNLSTVILLLIFSAGLLAFIVLYNLTNINLTERIREIATIKVLGFYPRETAAYIFRENLFITAISAVMGSFLGKGLHRFVISKIKVDMVCFDSIINPLSYVYSIALTFLFGFLVMFIMFFKLRNINMTESLKSVE